ncbi:MAG: hypothetical protein WC761_03185 [Candidatus Paceibacterota bacterium]|jgi:hypothetical protein
MEGNPNLEPESNEEIQGIPEFTTPERAPSPGDFRIEDPDGFHELVQKIREESQENKE